MDETPLKIIIRMPNWIGDLVMATPLLTDLRKAFPRAHITAMARKPICELLQEDPEIDELFCFSKGSAFDRRSEQRDIVEKIRRGQYDVGILLTNWFSSAWLFWDGKVKRRIGFRGRWRSFLLTDKVELPKNVDQQHLVMTYKKLLEPLGIRCSETKPRLFVTEKERQAAKVLLQQRGITSQHRLVGINPGATYGSAKCWLPERFRKVTEELLQQKDVRVIYFGDTASMPMVREICEGLPSVVNLAGVTTLRELAALIQLCDVLLTNDSGPMHIAAALGTEVVALFGSTNEVTTGPYQTGKVIHKHVECSPCYKRVCPIDFKCMKQIETDEVTHEILEVLAKKKST